MKREDNHRDIYIQWALEVINGIEKNLKEIMKYEMPLEARINPKSFYQL